MSTLSVRTNAAPPLRYFDYPRKQREELAVAKRPFAPDFRVQKNPTVDTPCARDSQWFPYGQSLEHGVSTVGLFLHTVEQTPLNGAPPTPETGVDCSSVKGQQCSAVSEARKAERQRAGPVGATKWERVCFAALRRP